MTSMLLVDDSAVVNELFAEVLRTQLDVEVLPVGSLSDLSTVIEGGKQFDFALVDLSFPEERKNGMDALLAIHLATPQTVLAVITQGDAYVAQLLRDVWELLPVVTVISKAAPIDYQIGQVRQLLATGTAPIDPSVQPLLPAQRPQWRTLQSFERLVVHVGHAKLWEALFEAGEDVSYRDVVEVTGLRLNTVKNYRAQLLPELVGHGLYDPSLRELRDFSQRCRPILERWISEVRSRSRHRTGA